MPYKLQRRWLLDLARFSRNPVIIAAAASPSTQTRTPTCSSCSMQTRSSGRSSESVALPVLAGFAAEFHQAACRFLYAPSPFDSGPTPCEIRSANVGPAASVNRWRSLHTTLIIRPCFPAVPSYISCGSRRSSLLGRRQKASFFDGDGGGHVTGVPVDDLHKRESRRVFAFEIQAPGYPRGPARGSIGPGTLAKSPGEILRRILHRNPYLMVAR